MATLLTIPRLLILMILFSFLSVGAVIFTPAYPAMAEQFHLSNASSQWMITLFLLGSTFGRLPYGPLANRIGRKKTLWIGLSIALMGTSVILSSQTYFWICVGRLIQALGCAVTLKIGYTMIGDLYHGAQATKLLSYSMLAYAILPGIGTAVSGYFVPSLGWKAGFWFFLVFNIGVICASLGLPETLKQKDPHALNIQKMFHSYRAQFKNVPLILWGSLMGLSTAIIFIFSQEAPFVAIDLMGMTPAAYGMYYLIPALGIAAGAVMTSWLSDQMSALTAMLLGIAMMVAGSLMMGVFLFSQWMSGWALFLPQVLIQIGDALLYTNASSRGLSDAQDKASATAVMLFINGCGAILGTFLVGAFLPRALMTLPAVFFFISLLMIGIWLKLRDYR